MNLLRLVAAASAVAACAAWVAPGANPPARPEAVAHGRRDFFASLVVGSASAVLLASSPAVAASQEQKDKENIVKGYNRLQYLLDNWEEETTVCKTGQEVCEVVCALCTYCNYQDCNSSSSYPSHMSPTSIEDNLWG